jgi:hypothetical protein
MYLLSIDIGIMLSLICIMQELAAGGKGISSAKQKKAAANIKKNETDAAEAGIDCFNVLNEDMMLQKIWDRISFGASVSVSKQHKERSPAFRVVCCGSFMALRALVEAGLDPSLALQEICNDCSESDTTRTMIRMLITQFGADREIYNKLTLRQPLSYPSMFFDDSILSDDQFEEAADKKLGITAQSFVPTQDALGNRLAVGLPSAPPTDVPPELADLFIPKPWRARVKVIPTSPLRYVPPQHLVLPDQSAFH